MFEKVNMAEASKASTGGNYVTKSGVYENITLKHLIMDTNENGQRQFSMFIDYNGQEQTIYGAFALENYNGETMPGGVKLFDSLRIIAGNPDIAEPTEMQLPIGKAKAMKDVLVLSEFDDLELTLIAKENYYRKGTGEISGNVGVKAFFNADGASSDELINDTEVGVKLAKQAVYAEDVTYSTSPKSAVTKEEVDAWIAAGRGQAGGASTPAATSSAPKQTFGKKKFGA